MKRIDIDRENAKLQSTETSAVKTSSNKRGRQEAILKNKEELIEFIFGARAVNPLDKKDQTNIFLKDKLYVKDILKKFEVNRINKKIEATLEEWSYVKSKEEDFPFRTIYVR